MLCVGSADAQSVESIMRARERLELTEQQIQQLDALRRESVQRRNAEMAQIAELRSQLEAGQARRSDLMAAMEDQQEARQATAEQRRASIDAVLTEAQRETLQQMGRRDRRQRAGARPRAGQGPVRGPRAGVAPGRGPGAGAGFAPGRGPGFAPGPRAGRGAGPQPGDAGLIPADPDSGPR